MNAPITTQPPPAPPAGPPVPPPGPAAPRNPTPPAPAAATRTRRRRRLRLVAPYAVVLVLILISGVAYTIEEPDPRDPDFLSPTSTAKIGAGTLADRLRQHGVTIERQQHTTEALVSAHRGDAILLIPAPDLLHPYYLRMLKLLPASTTVVLVRPSDGTLRRALLPALVEQERWAAQSSAPECGYPVAVTAGRASATRNRYRDKDGTATNRCYRGGLIRVTHHATTLTLVGASDPFRNDRIDEHGNSALAVGLLADGRRVVWLDVHVPEPGPTLLDKPGLDESPAPASLGRGTPDPDFPVPAPQGSGGPQPNPGRPSRSGGGPGIADLFPATAWAVAGLVMVAAVLAALARARRLGAPVPEPLPVVVPSSETVTGRGRLYERSRDRGAALEVLRAAARERLARLLDLTPEVDQSTLVTAVAAHSGWSEEQVGAVVQGPAPADDAELVAAAAALESLIAAVTKVPGRPPDDPTDREERM